jgi:hypothetical protein
VVGVQLAAAVLEQIEGDPLVGLLAALVLVAVADLAELLDRLGVDAGLLVDLADGGLDLGLIPVGMALGEREHAVAGTAAGNDHDPVVAANDHASR